MARTIANRRQNTTAGRFAEQQLVRATLRQLAALRAGAMSVEHRSGAAIALIEPYRLLLAATAAPLQQRCITDRDLW
jgi:hypothetical protein